jgi:cytoskeletal protein CcmA (bactofilin family)
MAIKNEANACVIGENSVFEGKFQGDIKTEDQVTVGPTGKVRTDIIARKVTVAGTLIGNITASEEVNLIQNGKVLGNISTPKLNVENGVITEGKVTITNGRADSVSKVIQEAYGEDAEQLFSAQEKTIRKEKAKDKDSKAE